MKRDEITHTQLTALIWAGVLAPAAELLPALMLPLAGRAAWLTPAWAIPLVLLAGWLLGGLAGERGPAHTIRAGLGPWAGRGVLAIYLVWCELLLALRAAAVRTAPAARRRAGWITVVFSGCCERAGAVDGAGKAVCLCQGGTNFSGGALCCGGCCTAAVRQSGAD